jgi:hypothetical protein
MMDLRARLAARRAQARRVLWFERIWPALWPAFALIGAWIALALFDIPGMLPVWWHIAALGFLVVALGVLLWRGLRPLARPTDAEVDRRLELTSGVRHRPLVVLDDKPAEADPAATELWQAHLARAAAQVARLRAGWPHPGIPQRDVWATRAALAVLLVAGLVMAGPEAPARLLRSVSPGLPEGAPTPAPQLQVWLTPPSYTGGLASDREPDGRLVRSGHAVRRCGHGVRYARRDKLAGGARHHAVRHADGDPARLGSRPLATDGHRRPAANRRLGRATRTCSGATPATDPVAVDGSR